MRTAACSAGRNGERVQRAVVGLGLEQHVQHGSKQQQHQLGQVGGQMEQVSGARPAAVEASRPCGPGAAWALQRLDGCRHAQPMRRQRWAIERLTRGPHAVAKI
jgi:hypothetical protein